MLHGSANHDLIQRQKAARCLNWAQLARNLGVDPTLVSHTAHGDPGFANPRIRKAIAKALGMPARAIWPDDGLDNGQSLKTARPKGVPPRGRAVGRVGLSGQARPVSSDGKDTPVADGVQR
jgi:lambda repressor-like predicted transcriptional regulator